ncbi:NAD(P)/FAD-dependent oxidoreductase [Haladaptatus sp. NG-WS-4]
MDCEVAIVGGGVAGVSAAERLAPDHDVILFEAGQIAGGATGHASGLVTVAADWAGQPGAAHYSLEFFREYDGTGQFSFYETPFVQLRTDPGIEELGEEAAGFRDRGFDVTAHDADSLDEAYPDVYDLNDHTGAMEIADAGWVDPYTYATTLADEAADAGVDIQKDIKVTDVRTEGGSVTGVDTEEKTVTAETVVVAAGWRTPDIAGVEMPVRPFRYQTANLETDAAVTDYPIAWDQHSRLYWRPERNGELHVGGGAYYVTTPGSVRSTTTEGFRRLVAATVPDLLPSLRDARFGTDDTCPTGDSATPDHLPIIDCPADGPKGLVVATGLHGFGIMAGPAIGRAIRAQVTGDEPPFPTDAFRLDRFDPDASWEFPYISASAKETGV